MRRVDIGAQGGEEPGRAPPVSALGLPSTWQQTLHDILGERRPRPVQAAALQETRILEGRRNVVVVAPTNGGKSLVGDLILLQEVRGGKRGILLEPLRALAQERAEDLCRLIKRLKGPGSGIKVCLTTGDYRLENEHFGDAPPDQGEIVVATPERLDAILRSPKNGEWTSSIGAVVVDEAHLVGDRHRGPTLECLIATLRSSPQAPRLVLLSATIGEPDRLVRWLEPADLVRSDIRVPRLHREIWEVEGGEKADDVLCESVKSILEAPGNAVLVFVYQRRQAESLARLLDAHAGGARAYHSALVASVRNEIREAFLSGAIRCVVTTTALALGLNLPATHVLVRDNTFIGEGRLPPDQLQQMMGRAGRGIQEGFAAVLVKPGDGWTAEDLASALAEGAYPAVRSAFADTRPGWRQGRGDDQRTQQAATAIASYLARTGETGATAEQIRAFALATLAGPHLADRVSLALDWSTAWNRLLAFRDEAGSYHLTVLGRKAVLSTLPLDYAAGFGMLLRDLLSLSQGEPRSLAHWGTLDHLVLMEVLNPSPRHLRRFSEKMVDQVHGWMEEHVGAAIVTYEWIRGEVGGSKASQLLGSLGRSGFGPAWDRDARKLAYEATFRAILLEERCQGRSPEDIERRWKAERFEGQEEAWRDSALWLLAGQARLCDIRCFYHHLLENCSADVDQVQAVKRALAGARHRAFDLMERLKYCSPLGPMLRGIRGMMKGVDEPMVGVGTVRRLEAAGINSLAEVATMKIDELVSLGIRKAFAKQIVRYCQRRMR